VREGGGRGRERGGREEGERREGVGREKEEGGRGKEMEVDGRRRGRDGAGEEGGENFYTFPICIACSLMSLTPSSTSPSMSS
jgi:hypothetical protein